MSAFSVDCPACGTAVLVDPQTMRVVKISQTLPVSRQSICDHDEPDCLHPKPAGVVHLGRPAPAGDSDWPEPEDAA